MQGMLSAQWFNDLLAATQCTVSSYIPEAKRAQLETYLGTWWFFELNVFF